MNKDLFVLLGIGVAAWYLSKRSVGSRESGETGNTGTSIVGTMRNLVPGVISKPDYIQSTIEDMAVRKAGSDRLNYDQWNYFLREVTGSYGRKFEDTGLMDRGVVMGAEEFMKLAGLKGIGAVNGVYGRFDMIWPVESQGTENVVAFMYRN